MYYGVIHLFYDMFPSSCVIKVPEICHPISKLLRICKNHKLYNQLKFCFYKILIYNEYYKKIK